MKHKIAIVLTFHNRKDQTLTCIEQLKSQENCDDYSLDFFACDDGSTDGTKEELLKKYPDVNVIDGDGNLFWARGMAAACEEAKKISPDYYLMVNDDVNFYPYAISEILSTYRKYGENIAVVGCTHGNDGRWTYGGRRWTVNGLKIRGKIILPSDPDPVCNVTNWNCFFVPAHIFSDVGDIDTFYEHSYADFDYSLRMEKKGYRVYSTSKYVGMCEDNPIEGTWQDKSLSAFKRWKLMQKRTAKPIKSDLHFYKKIFGVKGYVFVMKQYIKMIFE